MISQGKRIYYMVSNRCRWFKSSSIKSSVIYGKFSQLR